MRCLIPLLFVALAGCAAQPSNPLATLSLAPVEAKGGTTAALGAISLGPEVNMPGYQLRARAVTIQPGGYLAAHTHQGRPTMEYVAQGTVIEVRNGVPVEHQAGSMVAATNGVTHWWENHGDVPVILVPVDIFKP